MKIEQVAVQLYTLREHLKTPADIAATLAKVRAIGYTAVQTGGLGPVADSEFKSILDGEGLTLCATHEKGDKIRSEPQAIVDRLHAFGCKYTAFPHPGSVDFGDRAQVERMTADLEEAGRVLHEAGQVLTYHNHAVEFVRLGDKTALDYIYDHSDPVHLQGEIDTYWVQYGGGDPMAWCEKLVNRLPLLHIKDYRYLPENKPEFAEIGYGNLDWKKIIPAAEASGCQWFIVEQDVCPGDPFDSITKSFQYAQTHLCS